MKIAIWQNNVEHQKLKSPISTQLSIEYYHNVALFLELIQETCFRNCTKRSALPCDQSPIITRDIFRYNHPWLATNLIVFKCMPSTTVIMDLLWMAQQLNIISEPIMPCFDINLIVKLCCVSNILYCPFSTNHKIGNPNNVWDYFLKARRRQ